MLTDHDGPSSSVMLLDHLNIGLGPRTDPMVKSAPLTKARGPAAGRLSVVSSGTSGSVAPAPNENSQKNSPYFSSGPTKAPWWRNDKEASSSAGGTSSSSSSAIIPSSASSTTLTNVTTVGPKKTAYPLPKFPARTAGSSSSSVPAAASKRATTNVVPNPPKKEKYPAVTYKAALTRGGGPQSRGAGVKAKQGATSSSKKDKKKASSMVAPGTTASAKSGGTTSQTSTKESSESMDRPDPVDAGDADSAVAPPEEDTIVECTAGVEEDVPGSEEEGVVEVGEKENPEFRGRTRSLGGEDDSSSPEGMMVTTEEPDEDDPGADRTTDRRTVEEAEDDADAASTEQLPIAPQDSNTYRSTTALDRVVAEAAQTTLPPQTTENNSPVPAERDGVSGEDPGPFQQTSSEQTADGPSAVCSEEVCWECPGVTTTSEPLRSAADGDRSGRSGSDSELRSSSHAAGPPQEPPLGIDGLEDISPTTDLRRPAPPGSSPRLPTYEAPPEPRQQPGPTAGRTPGRPPRMQSSGGGGGHYGGGGSYGGGGGRRGRWRWKLRRRRW